MLARDGHRQLLTGLLGLQVPVVDEFLVNQREHIVF